MSKVQLRRQLRTQLDQLTFQELISRSGRLSDRFHDWAKVFQSPQLRQKVILSFYPFGSEPQIQIEPADPAEAAQIPYEIAYLRIEDWDKRIMKPRIARRDLPGQWEEFELPGTGGNRIFQPVATQPVCEDHRIAAVLVPGLGFTREGLRLGRGAGFYDRFLAQIPQALRIGVAFDLQMVQHLPCDEHDLPVDIILTESSWVETNRYSPWKNHGRIERA